MVPEHVDERHVAERHREQVGPLRLRGADQQAAVGTAPDREPRRPGVAPPDQLLRGGDEVVEHLLLVPQHPGTVPVLAVFAAAAQHCLGVHPAPLQPGIDAALEGGRDRHVEAAVPVEQRRRLAVAGRPLPAHHEDGDAGAVVADGEDLLRLVQRRVDGELHARVHLRAAARH